MIEITTLEQLGEYITEFAQDNFPADEVTEICKKNGWELISYPIYLAEQHPICEDGARTLLISYYEDTFTYSDCAYYDVKEFDEESNSITRYLDFTGKFNPYALIDTYYEYLTDKHKEEDIQFIEWINSQLTTDTEDAVYKWSDAEYAEASTIYYNRIMYGEYNAERYYELMELLNK